MFVAVLFGCGENTSSADDALDSTGMDDLTPPGDLYWRGSFVVDESAHAIRSVGNNLRGFCEYLGSAFVWNDLSSEKIEQVWYYEFVGDTLVLYGSKKDYMERSSWDVYVGGKSGVLTGRWKYSSCDLYMGKINCKGYRVEEDINYYTFSKDSMFISGELFLPSS